ncbi:hypothetical protein [Flavobacterium sp. BFFFF1]|uniref:hypothetical protein n=1 Tax=Flavobacterium sp. BFFFF1 TaxID=2015557 RepID=UPI0025BA9E0B|nr:hypothetical protein [Flavobacterium sp. BFFFF1]
MNKKRFLSLLLFIGIFQSYSQTSPETKGIASGRHTQKWEFICEAYVYSRNLEVRIAKTDKGGTLELSEAVSNPELYIGGTVYIYLEDNTFIVCTDKGLHQNLDGNAISLYTLSQTELNRLKNTAIKSIRFTIKGIRGRFQSQVGNFTAVNKKQYFDVYDKRIRNSFETEIEIKQLETN